MIEHASSSNRAEGTVVTLLRVTTAIIFMVHGAQKLVDIPGTAQSFASMGIPAPEYSVYVAIAGELLGGLGMLVGLLTRVAAFGPFCVMLVAIIAAHLDGMLERSQSMRFRSRRVESHA